MAQIPGGANAGGPGREARAAADKSEKGAGGMSAPPLARALETVTAAWRARVPVCVIELDDGRSWEFYECGVVRFRDSREDVEEWAPLWEYALE